MLGELLVAREDLRGLSNGEAALVRVHYGNIYGSGWTTATYMGQRRLRQHTWVGVDYGNINGLG